MMGNMWWWWCLGILVSSSLSSSSLWHIRYNNNNNIAVVVVVMMMIVVSLLDWSNHWTMAVMAFDPNQSLSSSFHHSCFMTTFTKNAAFTFRTHCKRNPTVTTVSRTTTTRRRIHSKVASFVSRPSELCKSMASPQLQSLHSVQNLLHPSWVLMTTMDPNNNEEFEVEEKEENVVTLLSSSFTSSTFFPQATILDIRIPNHKPLGCTVEESLASEETNHDDEITTMTNQIQNNKKKNDMIDPMEDPLWVNPKHVFVSKVVEGGYAQMAGLCVGDVVVGVTALFGDHLANVEGMGLDYIRGLVSSRPEEEPLWIRVARGTNVMERHECALIDLCTVQEPNGSSRSGTSSTTSWMDQGLTEFLSYGYWDDKHNNHHGHHHHNNNNNHIPMNDTVDDETMSYKNLNNQNEDDNNDDNNIINSEDVLNDLWTNWGEETDYYSNDDTNNEGLSFPMMDDLSQPNNNNNNQKNRIKPWSSRSSPSGTFVYDPKTGKMKNLDAM